MTRKQDADLDCGMSVHSGGARARRCLPFLVALCVGAMTLVTAGSACALSGYAGASLGLALSTIDEGSVEFDTEDWSPSETSWRILGGCQFTPVFGLEAGYISFGKGEVTEQINQDYFNAELSGIEAMVVGQWRPAGSFWAFARGGAIFWSSDMAFQFTGIDTGKTSESGTSAAFGLGAGYAFGKYFAMRAEYTRYAIDETKAGAGGFNVVSAGAFFAFGSSNE